MFNNKKSNSSTQSMNIDTLIGEQCAVQGNLTSQNSIKIEGGIVGNVISDGMIIIGENGWVKGNTQAKELLVFGRIEGDIVTQNLDLKSSACITGGIETHTLQVEPGAVYQGNITMHSTSAQHTLPDMGSKALPHEVEQP